ncbi:MAG: hypothetical protein ACI85N_002155, partial [Gammaproteobacteria bacterium]
MKTINFACTAIALGLLGLTSLSTVNAADGDLDATSDADSVITLEVTDNVKIVGLDAISFSAFDADGYGEGDNSGTAANDNFCVYVNGGGTYSLTASTAADGYTLTGGTTGDTINYTVGFNGLASASTTAVAVDVASAEFTGTEVLACGTENANVNIMLTAAELLTAL